MRFLTALILAALCLASAAPDQTPPKDETTAVQGKYIRKGSTEDFLELRPGGIAFLSQGRLKLEGNYKVQGDTVILTSPKMPGPQVAHLAGNTLTDPDGMVWEKQTGNTPPSPPPGPTMKETEAWIKRHLPLMTKDRVVTKYKNSTWADSWAIQKVNIADCQLVVQTAEYHESGPDWKPFLIRVTTRTITLADLDVGKMKVHEAATAAESTLSKPSYVVNLPARADKGKPFVLTHQDKPPQSVALMGLRVSTQEMANELAEKLRYAALLCGAPDAPPSAEPAANPVAAAPPATTAQPAPANAMTNAEVLSMVSAGLSDEVVSTAIRQAPARAFDLTPTGLIALKTKHVSDAVIAVMQASANPPPAPSPAPQPRPKYDASLAESSKAPAAPQPCAGVEMMGLYKNEIFDKAMGGGVVEWLAKIRNNTSVTKIVQFGWIDQYGQQQRAQVQIRGGEIASPRVDMTQARYIAPVRDLRLLSCE